jgi:hypothetical protein
MVFFKLLVQLWDRSYENGMRGFLGCGCVWLPCNSTSNGKLVEQNIELAIWRPCSSGLEGLTGGSSLLHKMSSFDSKPDYSTDMILPSCPDLRSIRELTVSPYLRSQLQVRVDCCSSMILFISVV